MPNLEISERPTPWGARVRVLLRGGLGTLVLVLAAALVHRLVAEVGWHEVRARLAAASPWGIALAVGLLGVQMLAWSLRLLLAIRRLARAPGLGVVFLSLVGTATLNLLLPFARLVAALLRARHLSLASEPRQGKRVFFGVVMYDQLAHLAVMSGLTYAGLVGAALLVGRRGLFVASLAAGCAICGIAFWVWRRHRGPLRARLERLLEERAEAAQNLRGSAVEGGKTAARVLLSLLADRALYGPSLLLGAAVFVAGAAAQWAVFAALGVPIHPVAVAVTVSLGQAAGVIFGTPGGLGATEAAMIATFGLFGVGRAEAASAVLLFRGLHYAVVLGIGLPALGGLELRFARLGRREMD